MSVVRCIGRDLLFASSSGPAVLPIKLASTRGGTSYYPGKQWKALAG
jgi:hypothetical protein